MGTPSASALALPNQFSKIIGTGSALPARCVSNEMLAAELAAIGIETSDQWIVERTGIRTRYFADTSQNTSDLAVEASRHALEAAGCLPCDIDLIIVATSTPDMIFPSTACIVQQKLGITRGAAFDIQAVCTGFIYALSIADSMIRAGAARKALVIGAEIFSKILDFTDRTTCVLFGDGAGAVVLSASEQPGILASELCADGRYTEILCAPGQVSRGQMLGEPWVRMNGQAVFKLAVSVLEKVARSVLDKAHKTEQDIDWLVPHQANIRIMQGTAKKLKLPEERLIVTVDRHGNTSAASVPLALDHAVRQQQIAVGDTLLLEAVGGGMTWGAVLLDF